MWIKKLLKQSKPFFALAPMADYTDSPFGQIVKQIKGVDVIFREMVSSEAIVRDSAKTLKMINFVNAERPVVQQIFGADPEIMARAADIIVKKAKPDGIDINMGCPVRKIVSNFNGCALMKDPKLAAQIVESVKSAISPVPLSVKIRLGWDDPDSYKTFIPVIEKAGADLITVHGRTKEQGYNVKCDWARIAKAKKIATKPLLANGDILLPEDVHRALEQTQTDGVMIARGALGNPWFFSQALDASLKITLEERIDIVLKHLKLHLNHYGPGNETTFRKHLAWYFKSSKIGLQVSGVKQFRAQLMQFSSHQELDRILTEFLAKNKDVKNKD
jgi:tRNA-dihydrouridine synthase B